MKDLRFWVSMALLILATMLLAIPPIVYIISLAGGL